MSYINRIVIHCAATTNGRRLANARETAAAVIDRWHKDRGFRRSTPFVNEFSPGLRHIGYHFVIDTNGTVEKGRAIGETGAHAKGYNTGSIGICLVGTDKFTQAQWEALALLYADLVEKYPRAVVCGHRDLSPDLNGDGKITSNEWTKICPGFDVDSWETQLLSPRDEWICEEHL
ncbi:N-acetylmuramoyl-L-alanine amidase [Limnobaculum zhutongyuii]|uniref:N-acetylmuramoyl-L-alanine amidase n=1 Tax=Limnobaculum zhutongyuii TaxID=2498113 RepID=A0A411WGQ4_9GAMM|nr:N-acetylmuramoyl-L-alanine amidase [Limnobaculum zhutongyuii]QBH95481.1 N-acetylmuramoyl-L-alanine amidase [Limnobaculum zhutongyuii]TQS88830.1 N-acetylmuramoyl-L-alanine amidase [Limnobaculum zhutongyuii]